MGSKRIITNICFVGMMALCASCAMDDINHYGERCAGWSAIYSGGETLCSTSELSKCKAEYATAYRADHCPQKYDKCVWDAESLQKICLGDCPDKDRPKMCNGSCVTKAEYEGAVLSKIGEDAAYCNLRGKTVCPDACKAACNEDGSCPSLSVCEDGNTQCIGNKISTCAGGVWGQAVPCAVGQTCKLGMCVAEQNGCTDGTRKCVLDMVVKCDQGTWKVESCSEGMVCEDGYCVEDVPDEPGETCEEGTRRCENEMVMVCNRGTWLKDKECAAGMACRDGVCVAGECLDGATRCMGDVLRKCEDGRWRDYDCKERNKVCHQGECVTCVDGEYFCGNLNSSDGDANDYLYECIDDKWDRVLAGCSNGLQCASGMRGRERDVCSGKKDEDCTSGQKRCNQGIVEKCDRRQWVPTAEECEDECVSGKYKCEKKLLYKCIAGEWFSKIDSKTAWSDGSALSLEEQNCMCNSLTIKESDDIWGICSCINDELGQGRMKDRSCVNASCDVFNSRCGKCINGGDNCDVGKVCKNGECVLNDELNACVTDEERCVYYVDEGGYLNAIVEVCNNNVWEDKLLEKKPGKRQCAICAGAMYAYMNDGEGKCGEIDIKASAMISRMTINYICYAGRLKFEKCMNGCGYENVCK